MLHYVTFGSNDMARSKKFYDASMQTLGLVCTVNKADELAYGPPLKPGEDRIHQFWIVKPYLALPATWGNGTMITLTAESRAAVAAFHAAAMGAGGIDEGAPGLRPWHEHFYACYVRDPDGNKLSVACEKPE
ncbi:MAG: VOC family protein [Aestuariivirga sp.]